MNIPIGIFYKKVGDRFEIMEKIKDGGAVHNGCWELDFDTVVQNLTDEELEDAVWMCWGEHDQGKQLAKVFQKQIEKEVDSLISWHEEEEAEAILDSRASLPAFNWG